MPWTSSEPTESRLWPASRASNLALPIALVRSSLLTEPAATLRRALTVSSEALRTDEAEPESWMARRPASEYFRFVVEALTPVAAAILETSEKPDDHLTDDWPPRRAPRTATSGELALVPGKARTTALPPWKSTRCSPP